MFEKHRFAHPASYNQKIQSLAIFLSETLFTYLCVYHCPPPFLLSFLLAFSLYYPPILLFLFPYDLALSFTPSPTLSLIRPLATLTLAPSLICLSSLHNFTATDGTRHTLTRAES